MFSLSASKKMLKAPVELLRYQYKAHSSLPLSIKIRRDTIVSANNSEMATIEFTWRANISHQCPRISTSNFDETREASIKLDIWEIFMGTSLFIWIRLSVVNQKTSWTEYFRTGDDIWLVSLSSDLLLKIFDLLHLYKELKHTNIEHFEAII